MSIERGPDGRISKHTLTHVQSALDTALAAGINLPTQQHVQQAQQQQPSRQAAASESGSSIKSSGLRALSPGRKFQNLPPGQATQQLVQQRVEKRNQQDVGAEQSGSNAGTTHSGAAPLQLTPYHLLRSGQTQPQLEPQQAPVTASVESLMGRYRPPSPDTQAAVPAGQTHVQQTANADAKVQPEVRTADTRHGQTFNGHGIQRLVAPTGTSSSSSVTAQEPVNSAATAQTTAITQPTSTPFATAIEPVAPATAISTAASAPGALSGSGSGGSSPAGSMPRRFSMGLRLSVDVSSSEGPSDDSSSSSESDEDKAQSRQQGSYADEQHDQGLPPSKAAKPKLATRRVSICVDDDQHEDKGTGSGGSQSAKSTLRQQSAPAAVTPDQKLVDLLCRKSPELRRDREESESVSGQGSWAAKLSKRPPTPGMSLGQGENIFKEASPQRREAADSMEGGRSSSEQPAKQQHACVVGTGRRVSYSDGGAPSQEEKHQSTTKHDDDDDDVVDHSQERRRSVGGGQQERRMSSSGGSGMRDKDRQINWDFHVQFEGNEGSNQPKASMSPQQEHEQQVGWQNNLSARPPTPGVSLGKPVSIFKADEDDDVADDSQDDEHQQQHHDSSFSPHVKFSSPDQSSVKEALIRRNSALAVDRQQSWDKKLSKRPPTPAMSLGKPVSIFKDSTAHEGTSNSDHHDSSQDAVSPHVKFEEPRLSAQQAACKHSPALAAEKEEAWGDKLSKRPPTPAANLGKHASIFHDDVEADEDSENDEDEDGPEATADSPHVKFDEPKLDMQEALCRRNSAIAAERQQSWDKKLSKRPPTPAAGLGKPVSIFKPATETTDKAPCGKEGGNSPQRTHTAQHRTGSPQLKQDKSAPSVQEALCKHNSALAADRQQSWDHKLAKRPPTPAAGLGAPVSIFKSDSSPTPQNTKPKVRSVRIVSKSDDEDEDKEVNTEKYSSSYGRSAASTPAPITPTITPGATATIADSRRGSKVWVEALVAHNPDLAIDWEQSGPSGDDDEAAAEHDTAVAASTGGVSKGREKKSWAQKLAQRPPTPAAGAAGSHKPHVNIFKEHPHTPTAPSLTMQQQPVVVMSVGQVTASQDHTPFARYAHSKGSLPEELCAKLDPSAADKQQSWEAKLAKRPPTPAAGVGKPVTVFRHTESDEEDHQQQQQGDGAQAGGRGSSTAVISERKPSMQEALIQRRSLLAADRQAEWDKKLSKRPPTPSVSKSVNIFKETEPNDADDEHDMQHKAATPTEKASVKVHKQGESSVPEALLKRNADLAADRQQSWDQELAKRPPTPAATLASKQSIFKDDKEDAMQCEVQSSSPPVKLEQQQRQPSVQAAIIKHSPLLAADKQLEWEKKLAKRPPTPSVSKSVNIFKETATDDAEDEHEDIEVTVPILALRTQSAPHAESASADTAPSPRAKSTAAILAQKNPSIHCDLTQSPKKGDKRNGGGRPPTPGATLGKPFNMFADDDNDDSQTHSQALSPRQAQQHSPKPWSGGASSPADSSKHKQSKHGQHGTPSPSSRLKGSVSMPGPLIVDVLSAHNPDLQKDLKESVSKEGGKSLRPPTPGATLGKPFNIFKDDDGAESSSDHEGADSPTAQSPSKQALPHHGSSSSSPVGPPMSPRSGHTETGQIRSRRDSTSPLRNVTTAADAGLVSPQHSGKTSPLKRSSSIADPVPPRASPLSHMSSADLDEAAAAAAVAEAASAAAQKPASSPAAEAASLKSSSSATTPPAQPPTVVIPASPSPKPRKATSPLRNTMTAADVAAKEAATSSSRLRRSTSPADRDPARASPLRRATSPSDPETNIPDEDLQAPGEDSMASPGSSPVAVAPVAPSPSAKQPLPAAPPAAVVVDVQTPPSPDVEVRRTGSPLRHATSAADPDPARLSPLRSFSSHAGYAESASPVSSVSPAGTAGKSTRRRLDRCDT